MRNSFKLIAAGVAILATALACNKEQTEPDPQEPEFVTLNFEADGNLANTDTKTVLGSPDDNGYYNISWTTGEYFNVFESNSGSYSSVKSKNASTSNGKMSFKAEFASATGTSFIYYSLYPYNESNAIENGIVTVNIPSVQEPSLTSFDPKADLLISKASETYSSQLANKISFQFARMVSLTMMTIKGLSTTDPVVSVTFTAEGKQLAGSCKYDITTTSMTEVVESTESITLNYDKTLNFTNNCTAYMFSLPMTLNAGNKFRVDVLTENASGVQTLYSKEVTAPEMKFEAGGGVKFGVNFTGIDGLKFFRKVTETPEDWAGRYLIINEDFNTIFNGSLGTDKLAENNNGIVISRTDSNIIATTDILNSSFTIKAYNNGYSIQSASGIYISRTTNSAGIDLKSEGAHSLTLNSKKNVIISSEAGAILRYNDDNNVFKYYKGGENGTASSGKIIQLYKLEE